MMNSADHVQRQYADDKNLAARKGLHDKYSVNTQGFVPWLFEKYRFGEHDFILELGCGNGGPWQGRLEGLPPGCRLVLSDLTAGMISATWEKLGQPPNVTFEQIDIQAIPHGDGCFDVAIANHMLYHVPDLAQGLSEVRRVLKPGGRFYAATNGNGGMRSYLRDALRRFDPETKAFAQEFSFSLQNGGGILEPYFSSVERVDYVDSLAVTDTQDLMDWLQSSLAMAGCPEGNFAGLYDYFEGIRIREGAIRIPKEAGLFICEK